MRYVEGKDRNRLMVNGLYSKGWGHDIDETWKQFKWVFAIGQVCCADKDPPTPDLLRVLSGWWKYVPCLFDGVPGVATTSARTSVFTRAEGPARSTTLVASPAVTSGRSPASVGVLSLAVFISDPSSESVSLFVSSISQLASSGSMITPEAPSKLNLGFTLFPFAALGVRLGLGTGESVHGLLLMVESASE